MTKLLAALMASATFAGPALARTALGLPGDRTLVMIDTGTAAVTGAVEVRGWNDFWASPIAPAPGG